MPAETDIADPVSVRIIAALQPSQVAVVGLVTDGKRNKEIDDLKDKARYFARLHDLDGALICAVIEQESNWVTWAIRYEPAFQVRYVDPQKLGATEATARSISWGLMQLMGESAREMGFNGKMASLCDPDIGLEWGCKHLKAKLDAHGGDVHAGLLAWNGGGNTQYADEVLARLGNYTQ